MAKGASMTPAELCAAGESVLHETGGPRILTYCEQGQIARREIFFKNSKQVSSLELYKNSHLVEVKSFSTSGKLGSHHRYEYLGPNHWIREKIHLSGEDVGKPQRREELINFNPYEGLDLDYQVIKEWSFDSKPLFHVKYADLFTLEDQKRPYAKETYSERGELLSTIYFKYEGSSERPMAYEERFPSGELRSYELYTPFAPSDTWRQANLSIVETQKRWANLNNSQRFKIAIIDSGFDYNHLELAHQWWQNPKDKLDGLDNDGNGWTDDVFGWDQVRDIGLPSESSTNLARDYRPLSHGTHVAHIASRNLWGAALIGFAGDYTQADYIKKISKFIKEHEIKLVNMSLGLPSDIRNNMGLRDAVNAYKKMVADNPQTLFIFAAGNASSNIDEYKNRQWPANIKGSNTLTVGALDTDEYEDSKFDQYQLAWYSNYGEKNVDILAPGTGVEAASLGGGLIKHSGTSMASPYMVNLVAKLWMEYPEFSASEVREIFMKSAYPMKPRPQVIAGGFAHLKAARELAKEIMLERLARALKNKKSALSGPNCWNSALYLSRLTSGIHHTTDTEFRYIIESPLCQKVEIPKSGDVIALRRVGSSGRILRGPLFSEVHGYTYLNTDRALSKNGTDASVGYDVLANDEVLKYYQRTDKRSCKINGIPREHCNLVREYYRCDSLESFLLKHPWPTNAHRTFYEKLTRLEQEVGKRYLDDQSREDAKAFKQFIQNEVGALRVELEQLSAQELTLSREGVFLMELMDMRLESLRVTQF